MLSRPARHATAAGLMLALGAGLGWALADESEAAVDALGEQTGGSTTVPAVGRNAFSFPFANLDDEERQRFAVGNSFFRRNWVEAPASTTARDGLGPHFIARSCGGCHDQDGRGAPPDFKRGLNEQPIGLLVRISVPVDEAPKPDAARQAPRGGQGSSGAARHSLEGEGPMATAPEPVYGDQFNNRAVGGVKPEGEVRIRLKPVTGRFADGTRYTLQAPHYSFARLAYGPMQKGTLLSPRIAPQLPGVGLIDAIAEGDILANETAQREMSGPIKGRANHVSDIWSGEMRVGRFGWKANVPTLVHQTAGAFLGDMGITSRVFPKEACTAAQADCLASPHGGQTKGGGEGPEIDDTTLSHVVFYESTLAPPARRDAREPEVLRGQKLFQSAQCAVCHRPSYVTAGAPFPALSSPKVAGQKIYPYTDLLLHDMGPGLADGRPDGQANGRQWKTPPLWGIGLIRDVNGHQRLLHDGRANGVLEAVLWHGGEAEASKQRVLKMSGAERAALVKFVESL
ncbi:di-heme oxidoredictase family protein [Ideonella sp.]|uniref:di-heme oxidoreductase family protein n=1 Tax=Ideonella sp. TaxID=1929293 RepID=UPI0039C8B340